MKILQFGTGRFLRGFFDPIIAKEKSITVVQSREQSKGANLINQSSNGYHVWTRGKLDGEIVDDVQLVHSLNKALVATTEWNQVQNFALDPELNLIVSNTTEQGLQLDEADHEACEAREGKCPISYPAKLLDLLFHRFKNNLGGFTILPMELIEFNADKLKSLVLKQAQLWDHTRNESFRSWLTNENRWLSNLVDRIVVNVSDAPPWNEEDPLAVVGEPYRMLAIQDDGGNRSVIPDHPMIEWTNDLRPKFLRKVRILNGLHTAMVAHSLPQGFETVLDAVSDSQERNWIEELLHEEILPTLKHQGLQENLFAAQVLERFENPFFKHYLKDIASNHQTKLKTRVQPTADEYRGAFGTEPTKLNEVLASKVSVIS